jgi:hypothetical protein
MDAVRRRGGGMVRSSSTWSEATWDPTLPPGSKMRQPTRAHVSGPRHSRKALISLENTADAPTVVSLVRQSAPISPISDGLIEVDDAPAAD